MKTIFSPLGTMFQVLRQTFEHWNANQVPRLAAALAYYTAFSLAPLLVLVIAFVGLVFSEELAREQVMEQVRGAFGQSGVALVGSLIDSASRPSEGVISTILSLGVLLLGALAAFGNLQSALDTIFGVEGRMFNWRDTLRDKLLSFGMVLMIGFMLLVSMVINTILTAVTTFLLTGIIGAGALLQMINMLVSVAIITVLFALMFKFLPHTRLQWRDVWLGAAVTSILFSVGRFAIGWYLATTTVTSAYGAAGSLALILLWIYYSAQIVLFGAAFTHVVATRAKERREQERAEKIGAGVTI